MDLETVETADTYAAPVLVELDSVPNITFGKYAEDSQDQGRYFE